jgi:hypothetical protein
MGMERVDGALIELSFSFSFSEHYLLEIVLGNSPGVNDDKVV